VKAVVAKKVAGEEVTVAESAEPQAQVIDLMQALKESLGRRRSRGAEKASHAAKKEAVGSERRQAASRRRARKG
jgi:non-homologous end joining protein Ku